MAYTQTDSPGSSTISGAKSDFHNCLIPCSLCLVCVITKSVYILTSAPYLDRCPSAHVTSTTPSSPTHVTWLARNASDGSRWKRTARWHVAGTKHASQPQFSRSQTALYDDGVFCSDARIHTCLHESQGRSWCQEVQWSDAPTPTRVTYEILTNLMTKYRSRPSWYTLLSIGIKYWFQNPFSHNRHWARIGIL